MKILLIATGYPPYLFSENLCNGKLVMALLQAGIEVDVISRIDEGPSYGSEWIHPWDMLKPSAHIISYKTGNKLQRMLDVAYSGIKMGYNFSPGIRWMRRAYEQAIKLLEKNRYDVVLTRSPNDSAHFVGEKIKKRTGIKWIANWNDPATPIWPGQYKHLLSDKEQAKRMKETARLLKGADINTFPSDSLRQHFIENFPFLKNLQTEIIPHIGLCEQFWPAPAEKFKDNKLRFLHSGNLSAERNLETTFQAFRQLIENGFTDFEFHIMGHTNSYTTELTKKYQLEDYVKCLGSLPYMEALAKMQNYNVLVLLEARLEKGIFFASKFTDYLQTGLPILAISPTKGFAVDILSGKEGEYLADNQNPHAIYTVLSQIVNKWKEGTLSNCASKQIYKRVSSRQVVDSYITMIIKK